jgi:hypothetical protein
MFSYCERSEVTKRRMDCFVASHSTIAPQLRDLAMTITAG